jgi:oligosaccharide repeat unit polymerase
MNHRTEPDCMWLKSRTLRAVLYAGWTCGAIIIIWFTLTQSSASHKALIAGILFIISALLSRVVLGLTVASAPMLYLMLLGFVHLGLVTPWALGIYDVSRAPWFVPYGLSPALALVTYSILAYETGLIISVVETRGVKLRDKAASPYLGSRRLFLAGSCLFFSGVVMFVGGLIGLDPEGYFRLTYSDTFRLRAESDPRFFGSGITLVLIGLSLATAGAMKRRFPAVFWGAGLWCSFLFYFGFRGPALIAALVVCAVAVKKGVSFPRWLPWVAAVLMLLAIPVVHVIREEPIDERSLGTSLNDLSLLDGPAEIGSGIRPLVETYSLIDQDSYRYGWTYLIGLKGILPNLAVRWEAPSAGSVDSLPPNHWVTAMADPLSYENYGGIGFSAVAEPYMNFGIVGVIAYFFLLALILVRLEQVSIRSSEALACWAVVVGPLLWTTRNDFTNFFRPAAWGLLCIGAVWFFSRDRAWLPKEKKAARFSREFDRYSKQPNWGIATTKP